MNKKLDLISGELVTIECVMTSHATLKTICEAHGIKVTWQVVTPRSALKFALKKLYPDALIRPGAGRWCVVSESVDDDGNSYDVPDEYRSGDDWTVTHVDGSRRACAEIEKVAAEYRGMVVGRRIGTGFTKIFRNHFRTVSIRSGVHFVPVAQWDAWDAFAKDIASQTGIQCHRIQCGVDANTASAVINTASADLESRYGGLLTELGDLQEPSKKDGHDVWEKYRRRRALLLRKLEDVKTLASEIDACFDRGATLTEKIERDIKAEMALAVLS
jgi:hypothetical protein